MVLWSLSYLNSWYTAAASQLSTLQVFIQSYANTIVTALSPAGSQPPVNSGVSASSVLNLVSAVFSLVSNPYAKAAGGAAKFLGTLLQPPAINVTQPICALLDLENQLASGSGTMYLAALTSLSMQHSNLF